MAALTTRVETTMRTKYRLGISRRHVNTDLVFSRPVGRLRLYKALSTPADPTRAIEEGMRLVAEDLGESPAEIVSNSDLCNDPRSAHALIQHKGGKTGLICTAGHEDSIEIRLGHKEDGYRDDPNTRPRSCWCRAICAKACASACTPTGRSRTPVHEDGVRAACGSSSRKGSRQLRFRSFGRFSINAMSGARPRSFAR